MIRDFLISTRKKKGIDEATFKAFFLSRPCYIFNIFPLSIQFSYFFFLRIGTLSLNVRNVLHKTGVLLCIFVACLFFSSGKNFVKRHDAKVFQRPDR